MTTSTKAYLVFRQDSGELRLLDSKPVSPVDMVQDQEGTKRDIRAAFGWSTDSPVLALIFGGKYERPRKESPLPGVPAAPTNGDAG